MGKSAASTRRDLPLSAAFSRPEGYPPVCSRGIIFWSDPPGPDPVRDLQAQIRTQTIASSWWRPCG